jgi:thioredoxin 1
VKNLKDGDLLEKPFVIDFYADWCQPCKAIAPMVEQLAKNKPGVHFYKCKIDDAPGLVDKYDIRGIPFIVAENNGKEARFAAKQNTLVTELAGIGL